MKKICAAFLLLSLLCSLFLFSGCASGEVLTLNVYNWGENISDGSEGSFYTVREFEKWYEATYGQKVKVNYDVYTSNEDMYAKLKAGAVSYDLIIPSDYMIARLAAEEMLLPIDFKNVPNYSYIGNQFKGLYYDPDNQYSIPYTYGVIGIIYDANQVDEADVGSWDLMWNAKYAGKILQYNNPRDASGTAFYKLGLDVNTTDHSVWDRACDELMVQKPLRYGLVMDEIFNLLESGEAAIGSYYAGDYFTMKANQADNVDLKFYYPEQTNYFVDAMCIPSCCEHKELAEIFIDYMLSEEPAIANAEYTSYASPNSLVYENAAYKEDMGTEITDVLYAVHDNFTENYQKYAYLSLDQATLDYVNTLWEKVKIN